VTKQRVRRIEAGEMEVRRSFAGCALCDHESNQDVRE
jgi:hypothetical protein